MTAPKLIDLIHDIDPSVRVWYVDFSAIGKGEKTGTSEVNAVPNVRSIETLQVGDIVVIV